MSLDGKKGITLSGILTTLTEWFSSEKKTAEPESPPSLNDLVTDPYSMYYGQYSTMYNNGIYGPYSIQLSGTTSVPTLSPNNWIGQNGYAGITTGLSSVNATPSYYEDLVITRTGKPSISVAATIETICDTLNIILPDKEKLKENPSLEAAYEHYKEVLNKTILSQELKNAYDSYKIIEKLTQETEE